MKAVDQYVAVALFIIPSKVVLTFESGLTCDHTLPIPTSHPKDA